jgi:hypothetical protein
MAASARTWIRFLVRVIAIAVCAVAVMAVIGFALGGWTGAQGGAMWGLVAAAMAIPGMLLGIALNAGDSYADRRTDAFDKRYGSGPGR